MVIHAGGAPEWIVNQWMSGRREEVEPDKAKAKTLPIVELIDKDIELRRGSSPKTTAADTLVNLLDSQTESIDLPEDSGYWV